MKFEELSMASEPHIISPIPGEKSLKYLQEQSKTEGKIVSYPKASPIAIQKAMGATIMDVDGNIFLDFFGGAGVIATGHCNPVVSAAIKDIPLEFTHTLDFPHKYRSELIEVLQKILPPKMRNHSKIAFGGPTGSDAVESAIKLAKVITKRTPIIAFEGGYHGMTAGACTLNSGKFWKRNYIPMIPEVHFIPYAYPYRCAFGTETPEDNARMSANFYEHVLEDPHSGICDPTLTILEPIQGEGGSIVPHESFLKKIEETSRKYEIPLCFDEIQAGFCRTGKFFASAHSDATPDIMTISKALGGGFPLSAIVYHEDLDVWEKAGHIGTFRGNVIAMAA
ncbi:MAG: aspartate aminotransferase family protein, partial [Promethearchaeota archaeon]